MGDSKQNPNSGTPAWQHSQAGAETGPELKYSEATTTIEQARKFLQDEGVKNTTRDRKLEFLKGKGVEESMINQLLDEEGEESSTKNAVEDTAREPATVSTAATTLATVTAEAKENRPPIVTYPEFLTKPTGPPPLVTVNGFLNTIYAFGSLSTLVYGTSKYVLTPMVDSLTEARLTLLETANQRLGELVTKLEGTVSEIPASKKADSTAHTSEEDEDSEYDDPTEMFHRDIGVQTSRPSSPIGDIAYLSAESPSVEQSRRLSDLVASVKSITGALISQSEDYAGVKTVLDVFKDEVDQMRYPVNDFVGSSPLYSSTMNRNERDDEIKKAKENIRRVKGVLLSARSFPAGTR